MSNPLGTFLTAYITFLVVSVSHASSIVGTDFSNAATFQGTGGSYDQTSLDDLVPDDGITVSNWISFNSGQWQGRSQNLPGFSDPEVIIARLDGGNNPTLQDLGDTISTSTQSGVYFELTVDSGTTLDLTSIQFEWRQATDLAQTRTLTFGISITDTIIFKEVGVLRDNVDSEVITFSDSVYKNLSNTTVRFYFFAGEGSSTRDLEFDNIIINGDRTARLVGTDFSNATNFQGTGGSYDRTNLDDLVQNDGITVSNWANFNSGEWQGNSTDPGFSDPEAITGRLDGANNPTLQSLGDTISTSSQSGVYFDLTVDSNTTLDLTSIQFEWRQATSSDQTRTLTFGTSITDSIIFKEVGVLRNEIDNQVITFSDPFYKRLTNTTIRFYFFAGEGSSTRDLEFDNIIVNGVSPSIAPAPPTIATVGVGGSILLDPLRDDIELYDPSSLEIITQPSDGTATVVDGRILYTHTGNTPSEDSFEYRVSLIGNTGSIEVVIPIEVKSDFRLQPTTLNVPLEAPFNEGGGLSFENALPGLTFPRAVAIAAVPGEPKALLVASVTGDVWYVPDTTLANPSSHLVLDINSLSNFTRNRSIYSITCYPDFQTSGNVIVNYQGDESRLPIPGTGETIHDVIPNLDKDGLPFDEITTDLRISRFTLSKSHIANAMSGGLSNAENVAVLDTEYPFLNLALQALFHSINDCHFGPDGYLYVSFGDEGGSYDTFRNGQRITKDQYSSIIRIDVDPNSTNPKPTAHYAIAVGPLDSNGRHGFYTDPASQEPNFRVPADNPFIHTSLGGSWNGDFNGTDLSGQLESVRTEMWAIGLRNPFKFHLDQEDGTGETEAWVGDVGQQTREEFSILKKGENGGWSYYEGDIQTPNVTHPSMPSGATPHKEPLHAYPRSVGQSATGGIFYRSEALFSLTNRYICGDWRTGDLWSIDREGNVTTLPFAASGPVDFQVDPATGDIFVLEHGTGIVKRITIEPVQQNVGYPATLTETGLFGTLDDLTPNPGVLAYAPNLTFWSDGAEKQRWITIPDAGATIDYAEEGNWTFPNGTIWVKHFDYDLDQENPGTSMKRLETRVLVENAEDSYGVSYRWNEAGTEATLADADGENFVINFFDENGQLETLEWQIPSRFDCMTCHNSQAGTGLSMNTRQLNREGSMRGIDGNQIELLAQGGYLSGFEGDADDLEKHSEPRDTSYTIEHRVRSYLDVNCAYCHQPEGTSSTEWNGLAGVSLEDMGILYGRPVSESLPHFDDDLIRPGNLDASVILNRIKARDAINGTFNEYTQMPPLATNKLDEDGIDLMSEWILNHVNVKPIPVESSLTSTDISENTPSGTSIGVANSSDPDVRNGLADQNYLFYEITWGNEDGLFSINSATGELSVNGTLDFEKKSEYILTIRTSDRFAPNPGVEYRTVVIQLSDVTIADLSEDLNENGIHDAWEQDYGVVGISASSDDDKDGIKAFFEFLSGGSPVHSDDSLNFETSPVPNEDMLMLKWNALNGFRLGLDYSLETTTDLSSNSWAELNSESYLPSLSPLGSGNGLSNVSVIVPYDHTYRFFRLSQAVPEVNVMAAAQEQWLERYGDDPVVAPEDALLNTDPEPDLQHGFSDLFDGQSLDGWVKQGGNSTIEVVDGVIVGTTIPGEPSTYLSTVRDDYTDFIFSAEVKWEVDGNSGINFRSSYNGSSVIGPQLELEGIDFLNGERNWSGGIFAQGGGGWRHPLWLEAHEQARNAIVDDGWNRVTLLAIGGTVKTWINGVPAAHWITDEYFEGLFSLQVHSGNAGTVLFRNLKVKEL